MQCLCGCNGEVPARNDGRTYRYIKGHKSGIYYIGDVKTNCGTCGREISVHYSQLEKSKDKTCFCSRECTSQYRKERSLVDFTCSNCGKTIRKKKSRKQGRYVFCDLKCFQKHRKTLPVDLIDVSCGGCGKEFGVYPSKLKLNKHFYCSIPCRAKSIMGKDNPSFRSGWGRKREYSANWKSQRRKALIRDGYKCKACGNVPKISRYLHVHHRIPAYTFNGDWQKANDIDNLVTLCFTCHGKAESGKIVV